jgi:hypothetical protein
VNVYGKRSAQHPWYPNSNKESLSPELLIDRLGFELVSKLKVIIATLKKALANPNTNLDRLRPLWTEYSQRFEELAERTDSSEEYAIAQIAAIIYKAHIFRDIGKELRYLEELDKADMYSTDIGSAAFSTLISEEIDLRVAELEESAERLILQLRGKVSDANRAQMWDLWTEEQDYEDLVNHAFEMLLEDGEDPNEVLTELGALES